MLRNRMNHRTICLTALFAAFAVTASAVGQPSTPPGAASSPETVAPPPASGPPAAFDDCSVCHTTGKGEAATIGPNLWGLGGRKPGTGDYDFSPAMKAYAVTWSAETLQQFIQRPAETVPGNGMAYPGQSDPALAKSIAEYLMTLKD